MIASLLVAVPVAPPSADAQTASTGGPLVLLGIDAEDGGVGAHGPINNYVQLVDGVLGDVQNAGTNGILVIGDGKVATDNVTSFWNAVAAGVDATGADGTVGEPITHVNGATAISNQSLAGFEVIGVASGSFQTASGGLTSAENDAWAARDNDIATFVNGGGGLVGFEQSGFATPFNYLAGLGAFSVSSYEYSNINPTADGQAVGVTDALDVCCWHEVFDTYPDWLAVLATEAVSGTNRVAALGGQAARLPGGALTVEDTFGAGNRSHRHAVQGHCGEPVNCATGNFWHAFTDLAVPSRGPDLVLERTYNALGSSLAGVFGFGWSSSADMRLVVDGSGNVTVRQENGSVAVFSPDGSGGYTSLPRVMATMVKDGAGYTFVRQKRETFRFDLNGRLLSLTDLNGYQLTLAYDAAGDLAAMTDAAGRSFTFTHDTAGRIIAVTDPAARSVSYAYDAAGDLTSVTDAKGGVTSFTYDTSHRMLTMTDPRGGVVSNTYDTSGRVTEQRDDINASILFDYTATGTTITNARGNTVVQQYQDGMLTSLSKGVGTPEAATWAYTYDPFTLGRESVTDPNGHMSTRT